MKNPFKELTTFEKCLWTLSLTFLRSPYYAVAYAANDVVLIILWVLASITDASYLPMVACFVAFLANDIYGFLNWKRIEKTQSKDSVLFSSSIAFIRYG